MPRRAPSMCLALALALRAGLVASQTPAGQVVVRGDGSAADGARAEGGAAFVTSVDLRARGRSAESVAELLLEAPGLQLRRSGDGFAPQRLSLRGAPAAHVLLALDGVVLNSAAGDDVDPALLPPAMLERAEVYRGALPLRFGSGGLAGAVEFTTRRVPARPTTWVGAGLGSFFARRAGVFVAARAAGVQGLFALSYRGTEGDFPFYDTRGTDDPGDDAVTTRANNRANAVDVLARFCLGDGPSAERPCAQLLAGFRRRGIAGVAGQPTDGPFSEQRRAALRVSAPLRGRLGALELYASASARDELIDNRGPIALSTARAGVDEAVGWQAEVGARGRTSWGAVRGEAVLRARGEAVDARALGAADGDRVSALAGVELSGRFGPLRLDAGVGAEFIADRGGGASNDRWIASPRLGARVQIHPGLELRANGAWLQRAPTLAELYGDRASISGNPSLRNERALNGDLGAVLRLASRGYTLRVEAAGFARAVEDVVVLRQSDRALYRPVNRDAARVLGVEAQARFSWRDRLKVTLAYAFVDARITAGQAGTAENRLPGVSPHDLYARVEGGPRWLRGALDLSVIDATPLDDANGTVVPARALLGASLTVAPPFLRGLTVGAQVTNLLDARVVNRTLSNPLGAITATPSPLQDWLGFPLPGRAVFVMVGVDDPAP
ncbi:MAG: TonB-dependent receptor [Polyangiales bacterium]